MELALYAGALTCWNRLNPEVPVNGNLYATAYKNTFHTTMFV